MSSAKLSMLVAGALLLGGSACDGDIMDPEMGPPGPTEVPIPPFAPAPAALSRLTVAQYQNSVRDLFGEPLVVPTDLEVDTPLHGFTTVGASEVTIGPRAAEQYEAAALAIAAQIFGDPARREAFVGCVPSSSTDPCIRVFLERFGLRIWRRPLETAEVDELATLAQMLGDGFTDPWKGLEWATAAMLQSPHFLFRVEAGEPTGSGERRQYGGYEMAERLSYFIWETTPDDELLAAAGRGDLDTAEGVRDAAERMLDDPRARAALTKFWVEYMSLDRLPGVSKSAALFPQWTPALVASARGEVERMFQDVVFDRDADFRDLLDTRVTFVDSELAALYGLPAPDPGEWTRVELPADGPRAGLLGTAAFLALNAHATVTSPTFRGKFIRTNLLCQDIPPPPPGVVTMLAESPDGPQTVREKLEEHRANPICAGCHNLMDPLGLGLENFDPVGAYRTTDNGLPIDAQSDVEGVAFENARELGTVLRENPAVGDCVARRLYRHALGHLEYESEERAIRDLAASFAGDGYRFRELVLDLVASEAFRYAEGQR